ncbi:MAG: DUF4381 family protein [Lysobacteraceae bacterium]|nr:MAG: DUF4381 family protein [Xanthomonadaceae bacterium]
MQGAELVLRDVHLPATPSWWPPAPGWWWVIGALLLLGAVVLGRAWWNRRRRVAMQQLFDEAVAAAGGAPERIAAMSELLRRASRRRDARADRLQGDDWLRFLDQGLETPVFLAGPGRLLAEGGFRREVDPAEYEALARIARQRFLDWMTRP